MFAGTMLTLAMLVNDATNPIESMIDAYKGYSTYQVMLKSYNDGKAEIIRYYFKKPGYVRMEFVAPFNGAVLIYSPLTKQAKLWPFGYRSFPSFNLSPDNRLIQSRTGQRVDRSDVGVLYQNVKMLQDHGRTEIIGTETIGGQESLHIKVEGDHGFVAGTVAQYQLWLDQTTGFPLKVLSDGVDGQQIEAVEMEGLKINPELPGNFFDP
jgi:outer membrane lipoprotein-sorting protein